MTEVSDRNLVTLPDGKEVRVSLEQEEWWLTAKGTGFIHPDMIAPDLDNPRRNIGEAALEELYASIKACGVRNPIMITPRKLAPWVRVAPEHENRPFSAVSGHRRREGASKAELLAVPVLVEIYTSEKDHRMDMTLLNKGQAPLTPLDEGFDLINLQKLGWTISELCKLHGVTAPILYGRIYLTKLHPSLQALLEGEKSGGGKRKKKHEQELPVTLASKLGAVKTPEQDELDKLCDRFSQFVAKEALEEIERLGEEGADGRRFGLQKLMYAVIKRRGLTVTAAIEFLQEHTLKLRAASGPNGEKTERFQPHNRKNLINTLCGSVVDSVVIGWREEEIRRIFANASWEEVEAFVQKTGEARDLLDSLHKTLKSTQKAKKPTSPEVLRLMGQKGNV